MNEGATGLIVTIIAIMCALIILFAMLGSGHNLLIYGIDAIYRNIQGSRVGLGM